MSEDQQGWFCQRTDLVAVTLRGKDVMPLLQSKLSADTRKWRLRGGGYSVATDINGKTLFDGAFTFGGDHVIAVMQRAMAQPAMEHLDRYIIMEDVVMSLGEQAIFRTSPSVAALFGSDAASPDAESPSAPTSVTLGADVLSFLDPGPVAGAAEWVLLADAADAPAVSEALTAVGLREHTLEDRERHEVAAAIPRLGRDFFVDQTIPLEAGVWNGLSLSKGCYLGQEVLERMF